MKKTKLNRHLNKFSFLIFYLFLASCSNDDLPNILDVKDYCESINSSQSFQDIAVGSDDIDSVIYSDEGRMVTDIWTMTSKYHQLSLYQECNEDVTAICTSTLPIRIVERSGGNVLQAESANYFVPYIEVRFAGGDLEKIKEIIENRKEDLKLEVNKIHFSHSINGEIDHETLKKFMNGYDLGISFNGEKVIDLYCDKEGTEWVASELFFGKEFDICDIRPNSTRCDIKKAKASCEENKKNDSSSFQGDLFSSQFSSCSGIGLRDSYSILDEEWSSGIFR
jgi:hypothetical protein